MILRSLRALWAYAALWYGLALLGLGSLAWSVLAVPLRLLLPARAGRALGRGVIARGFRFYLGALETVGADHFIFGTDAPPLKVLKRAGVQVIRDLKLPPQDEQKVFADNAKRLLKI